MPHVKLLILALTTSVLAHPDADIVPGKATDTPVQTGNGQWLYEAVPHWGVLPDQANLGPTHGGVVIDPQTGEIYASTDANHAIVVWKPDGSFVRTIAPECQGFHAMDVRVEDGETRLYGAQLGGPKPLRICKLDTSGKLVMEISQATAGEVKGGWAGLTAVAVAPDGSIFCSMGYGSQFIHKFDAAGNHIKTFGGPGNGQNVETNTSHGLAIDHRFGEPRLLVCDRENRRLFHTDLEGNWIGEYATQLRRPCSASIRGDFCAVAELEARVTVIDKNGTPVAFLGDNPDPAQWAQFGVKPEDMKPGIFTAPHGLSFDGDGNLYVEDWNETGRITKLRKIEP